MLEWQLSQEGIHKCRVLPQFLSLYVVQDVEGCYAVIINGKRVKRRYETAEEAKCVAIRGAKKLLEECGKLLEDNLPGN